MRPFRGLETATRLRRGMVYDPMSDTETLGDWDHATRTTVEDVLFSPGSSAEFPGVDLETLSTLATLVFVEQADITEGDRIIIRDALWEVTGRPADYGRGRFAAFTVTVRWLRDERG